MNEKRMNSINLNDFDEREEKEKGRKTSEKNA
jgi:hypothetical protein